MGSFLKCNGANSFAHGNRFVENAASDLGWQFHPTAWAAPVPSQKGNLYVATMSRNESARAGLAKVAVFTSDDGRFRKRRGPTALLLCTHARPAANDPLPSLAEWFHMVGETFINYGGGGAGDLSAAISQGYNV